MAKKSKKEMKLKSVRSGLNRAEVERVYPKLLKVLFFLKGWVLCATYEQVAKLIGTDVRHLNGAIKDIPAPLSAYIVGLYKDGTGDGMIMVRRFGKDVAHKAVLTEVGIEFQGWRIPARHMISDAGLLSLNLDKGIAEIKHWIDEMELHYELYFGGRKVVTGTREKTHHLISPGKFGKFTFLAACTNTIFPRKMSGADALEVFKKRTKEQCKWKEVLLDSPDKAEKKMSEVASKFNEIIEAQLEDVKSVLSDNEYEMLLPMFTISTSSKGEPVSYSDFISFTEKEISD